MPTFLRALRLLSIVIWVGGLIFFAFIVAPVAFHVLPDSHVAGLVVGGTLVLLHRVGLVSGAVFLVSTVLLSRSSAVPLRFYVTQLVLTVTMLGLTGLLQAGVLPQMELDRAAAHGNIASLAPSAPARADFDRLHILSERLEGTVLLAGVLLILLIASDLPHPSLETEDTSAPLSTPPLA